MNKLTLKRLNEALMTFGDDFGGEDEISFSQTSSDQMNNTVNPVKQFIYKRIVGDDDSELTEVEIATLESWKNSTSTTNDNVVRAESLTHLKSLLSKSYKYLGDDGNYNWIDTTDVTSFSELFGHQKGSEKWNGDITRWNISNVTNMNYAFTGCYNFDRDLSKWDFSNVKYMSGCFNGCNEEFRQQMKQLVDTSNLKTKFNIF